MLIFKESDKLNSYTQELKTKNKTIGFVPTMGALHNGHISLIQEAKKKCDSVICSIFVNPTQFNNPKDFENYPITLNNDIALLEAANCTILFLPTVTEIYKNGTKNLQQYDLGFIETVYDGAFRPGHFQGVCNVLQRLFEIVEPDEAFFGLKDYQQCMVIKKLVTIMQLQNKLKLNFCTTLREKDGLAMSSRNMRLNTTERLLAPTIYKSLQFVKENITTDNLTFILQKTTTMLTSKGFKPDYLDIADATTLAPLKDWDGKQKIVCLIAAFLNEVRLIDNMLLN